MGNLNTTQTAHVQYLETLNYSGYNQCRDPEIEKKIK